MDEISSRQGYAGIVRAGIPISLWITCPKGMACLLRRGALDMGLRFGVVFFLFFFLGLCILFYFCFVVCCLGVVHFLNTLYTSRWEIHIRLKTTLPHHSLHPH